MKIITWNVNGIRSCADKGFFEYLKRESPDILCVQETKAHPEQLSESFLKPNGYTSHWSSAERKGYSGTATFSLEKPEEVQHGIGVPKFDNEGRFVITRHPGFWLYNVYFPNGGMSEERHHFKQEFLRRFTAHLVQLRDSGQEIILVGDYNVAYLDIDVFDPKALALKSGFLPEEREWFRSFLDQGFVDCFRQLHPEKRDVYSWWSYRERARLGNRGWRIDHICVSSGLVGRIKSAQIQDHQMGSDHCPVVVELLD